MYKAGTLHWEKDKNWLSTNQKPVLKNKRQKIIWYNLYISVYTARINR